MPVIAVTIVDQTVGVTQVGEIGLTGPIGPTGTVSAAGDGTAAAPGIAFASDTDTGFWRPSANTLAASTGGTERLRVDSSGNVGIGTSPAATSKLDVLGQGAFTVSASGSTTPLILRNNSTAATQVVKMGFDSNGAIKASINAAVYNNDYMTFNVGSDTERMRIDNAGNVGIGTTSPSALLHVRSGASGVTPNADSKLVVESAGGTVLNLLSPNANYSAVYFGDVAGGSSIGGVIYRASAHGTLPASLTLVTDGANRLTVLQNGNVGIGTVAPGLNRLQISYNNPATIPAAGAGGHGLSVGAAGYGLNAGANTNGDAYIQAARWDSLALNYNLLLQPNGGNVGIGTTTPGKKLVVQGTPNATITSSDGIIADYGSSSTGVYTPIGFSWAGSTGVNAPYWGMAMVGTNYGSAQADLTFFTQASERVRILANGNVGIGTTAPGYRLHVADTELFTSRLAGSNAVGNIVQIEASGAGGKIYEFHSTANSAGGGGGRFLINDRTAGLTRLEVDTNGHILPGTDNVQNFGNGSFRWATIYAGTGTINTSDERYKVLREGGDLTDAEFAAWSNVRAIVYQDLDSFERKGSAARLHVGYSWQSIQAAFEAEGLDAGRYGLWCEDALEAPVEKTRMVSRPVEGQTETVPVLDDDGQPVFEEVQETEEVEQAFEEVRMIDGAPVLVKGVRTVAQPVFDSVQIRDEDGELIFDTPQPIEDPETGELVEGDPVPRMTPVPRMIRKAKTETVPVMEEVEETFTEMEPTGETRGALRYNQCSVIEAAWLRRELASVAARLSVLEAA